MAIFNPIAPEEAATNFTGRSQGIGTSKVFSTLFGGLSNMAEGWVKYRDEKIQEDIYEDTLAQTEDTQAPYIDALNPEDMDGGGKSIYASAESSGRSGRVGGPDPDVSAEVPSGITTGGVAMSRLQMAYNSGTIRDAYYHGQLQTMVRGLRSKYPGYNRQIDNIVQSVTGITPANALMSDFFQEANANASAGQKEADKWDTYLNTNPEATLLYPDVRMNPSKYASPEARAQIKTQVSGIQAADAENVRARNAIDLKMKMGESSEADALELGINEASQAASTVIGAHLNGDADFMKRLNEAVTNPSAMNPADIEALNANANALLLAQRQRIDAILDRPINENGDRLRSIIKDQTKIDSIYSAGIAPIQNILDALNNKDYGLAQHYARENKIISEKDQNTIYNKFPIGRALQAWRAIGGDFAAQAIISKNSTAFTDFQTAMVNSLDVLAQSGVGGTAGQTTQILQPDIDKGTQVDAKTLVGHIQDTVNALVAPGIAPELKVSAAEYLYSAKNLNFLQNFPMDQQAWMYSQLVRPDVSKALHDMNQTNPQVWSNYVRWSAENFRNLFGSLGEDVNRAIRNRKGLSVQWNPETVQFEVSFNVRDMVGNVPQGNRNNLIGDLDYAGRYLGNLFSSVPEGLLTAKATDSIRQMNLLLNSVKEIPELSGLDPNVEVLKMLRTDFGIDPTAPKEGNFWDQMGAGITGMFDYISGKSKNKYGSEQLIPGTGGEAAAPFHPLDSLFGRQPNQTQSPDERPSNVSYIEDVTDLAARSDDEDFDTVTQAGKGWTEVQSGANVIRRTGARNWRNNNPGNIEFGKFAKSAGAIGTDGRFAVFPSLEAGTAAQEKLLFEGRGYRGKTIAGAISRWAPPFENNTRAYTRAITDALGLPADTAMADLTPEQRQIMMAAMHEVEGFKEGKEEVVSGPNPQLAAFKNLDLGSQIDILEAMYGRS